MYVLLQVLHIKSYDMYNSNHVVRTTSCILSYIYIWWYGTRWLTGIMHARIAQINAGLFVRDWAVEQRPKEVLHEADNKPNLQEVWYHNGMRVPTCLSYQYFMLTYYYCLLYIYETTPFFLFSLQSLIFNIFRCTHTHVSGWSHLLLLIVFPGRVRLTVRIVKCVFVFVFRKLSSFEKVTG